MYKKVSIFLQNTTFLLWVQSSKTVPCEDSQPIWVLKMKIDLRGKQLIETVFSI